MMDQMETTTSQPDVVQESVADLALKTYTLYFLVCACVLGVLLYAALRKASKILCWNCMHGSNFTKDQKEDPRVPATMFRNPSILTTLQDRYDKHKSSVRSHKSDGLSHPQYVPSTAASTTDIEMADIVREDNEPELTFSALIAETDENPRIHRYLDTMESQESDPQEIPIEEEPHDNIMHTVAQIEPPSNHDQLEEAVELVEEEAIKDDHQDSDENADEIVEEKYNGFSNYGSMAPSETDTSHKQDSPDDVNFGDVDSDYNAVASRSSSSQGSLRSTTSDGAPLVSMDPAGDKRTGGRYKKYTPNAPATGTGVSTRSASAMSSRRASRLTDKFNY